MPNSYLHTDLSDNAHHLSRAGHLINDPKTSRRANPLVIRRQYQQKVKRIIELSARFKGFKSITSVDGEMRWRGIFKPIHDFPVSGWKVHISCTIDEFFKHSSDIVSRCLSAGIAGLKFPDTLDSFRIMSSGEGGESQIGKIFTIYPQRDSDLRHLIKNVKIFETQLSGPRLRSDVLLTRNGTLGLRFGAFKDGLLLDECGKLIQTVTLPDGKIREDVRSVDGTQLLPSEFLSKTFAIGPFASTEERHANALEKWKPLALIHRSPKGRVCLVVEINSPYRLGISKSASRGIMLGGYRTTAWDLLDNEFYILKALREQSFPCAEPLKITNTADEKVLVMEDLGGESLASLHYFEPHHLRSCLLLIQRLHHLGYYHRDIKPDNFVITEQKLHLIDFELTSRRNAQIAFEGGTPGFFRAGKEDNPAGRDLFGLAGCFFFFAFKESPAILPAPPSRAISLLQLHNKNIIAGCYQELIGFGHGSSVKVLECVNQRLSPLTQTMISSHQSASRNRRHLKNLRNWARRAAWEAGVLAKQMQAPDSLTGSTWRSVRNEGERFPANLAQGCAGTALSLATLDFVFGRTFFERQIELACEHLVARLPSAKAAGLFVGNSGIGLVLIVLGVRYRKNAWIERGRDLVLRFRGGVEFDPDFYFGGAGILFAVNAAAVILQDSDLLQSAEPIAHFLQKSIQTEGNIICWKNSGRLSGPGSPFLGAAHGAAGTALALSVFAKTTEDGALLQSMKDVFKSIFVHGKTRDCTQIRNQVTSHTDNDPVHLWCRGMLGVLWCFLITEPPEDECRDEVEWCSRLLFHGPSVGNPTYCHGLAARLDILRMLKTRPYLRNHIEDECNFTLQSTRLLSTRRNGHIVWPSETNETISPELWTGFLGTATSCALAGRLFPFPIISCQFLGALASHDTLAEAEALLQ